MGYIGNEPASGSFQKQTLTSPATDGINTVWALTFSVAGNNSIIVVNGNVIQEPGIAFTASGTVLTFTTAPPAGSTPYVIFLAERITIGVPGSSTISDNEINYPLIAANITGGTISGGARISDSVLDASNVVRDGSIAKGSVNDTGFVGRIRKTGASTYIYIKDNLTAVLAPTVNNDVNEGYIPGSLWFNTVSDLQWICVLNTSSAAAWHITGAANIPQAEAEAGTSTIPRIWSAERVKQSIIANSALGTFFESGEFALTADTVYAAAHGFGAVPKLISVILRCKVANFGYAIGDEIPWGMERHGATSHNNNFADATNVGSVFSEPLGGGTFGLGRRDTGGDTDSVLAANWRFVFRAWK